MTANDLVLLKRWQTRRDPEAFQELVHRHANMVFATCRRVLGNASDAEEVAQECFLSLADSADKPARSLGGWLHALAASRARDRIRGDVRRREREARYAAEQDRTTAPNATEAAEVLDDALAALPEKLREPLVVHFLEGLTHAETAKRLGVSRPTVSRRIGAGLERLRGELRTRNVVIALGALTKMLSAEAATAAPASLIVSLGKVALNASPYSVAAGGGGLMFKALAGLAILGAVSGLVVIGFPNAATKVNTGTAPIVERPDAETTRTVTQGDNAEPASPSASPRTASVAEAETPPPSPTGARVVGVVRDLDGNPASNAHVEVRSADDMLYPMGEAETGDDGRFSIDGLPPDRAPYVYAFAKNPVRRSPPEEIGGLFAGKEYEVNLTLHTASVSGTVLDRSGQAIPHAKVFARSGGKMISEEARVEADDRGRFYIAGLFAGAYDLIVKPGESEWPFLETDRIQLNEAEQRTGLRLVYDLGERQIWGTVTNRDGEGLSGVKVHAYDARHVENTFAMTDAEGAYQIALEGEGPFYVSVQHREYSGAFKRNIMPDTAPLDIVLEPRGSVEGVVVDRETSDPLLDFEVMEFVPVSDAPDTMYRKRWKRVSNPDGSFVLTDLTAGTFDVRVRSEGYAQEEQSVQVEPGTRTTGVTIPLDRARTIGGSVVDRAGTPIAGVRVFAGPLPSDYASSAIRTADPALTDAEGRFQIEDAPASIRFVSAVHHAYAPTMQAVGDDLSAIRVTLHEGGSAAGVVTVDGEPVAGATVFALLNPETHSMSTSRAKTGADGTFELLQLGSGPMALHAELKVEQSMSERFVTEWIEVNDGETTPVHLAFVTGTAAVEGRVTLNGRPDAGALVTAWQSGTYPPASGASVRTANDGTYRIEGLERGRYDLRAHLTSHPDLGQAETVTVTLPESAAVRIDLGN